MSLGKAKKERRKKKAEHRARLFELYAANWAMYFADQFPQYAGNLFMCPICVRGFNRDAVAAVNVNVAHIYPEACGGKLVTMTCEECNSRIGSKYDSHISTSRRLHDVLLGKSNEKLRGQIELNGIKVTADVSYKESGINFAHVAEHSNPEASKKFEEALKSGAADREAVKVHLPSYKYHADNYNIAILHSAYLAVFRMFGYEYIKGADTAWIRDILNRGAMLESGYPAMTLPRVQFPHDALFSVGMAQIDKRFRCVSAILPRQIDTEMTAVYLPGFGEDGRTQFEVLSTSFKNGDEMDVSITPLMYRPEERLGNHSFFLQGHRLWHAFAQSRRS